MTNVMLGMWLFILSEIMLFGALFSAYALLRSSASVWPPGGVTLVGVYGEVNTFLVLAALLCVVRARTLALPVARRLILIASVPALASLGVLWVEYAHYLSDGRAPSSNMLMAMFFALTALHAAHVIAGIAANLWVVASAGKIDDAMLAGRMRALRLYWAFVTIVWLIIFVLMYLS
jgi:heme/copper-type cytochrome/quinol oxidase subunit 3